MEHINRNGNQPRTVIFVHEIKQIINSNQWWRIHSCLHFRNDCWLQSMMSQSNCRIEYVPSTRSCKRRQSWMEVRSDLRDKDWVDLETTDLTNTSWRNSASGRTVLWIWHSVSSDYTLVGNGTALKCRQIKQHKTYLKRKTKRNCHQFHSRQT